MKPIVSSSAPSYAIRYLRKSNNTLKIIKIFGTVFGAAMVAVSPWIGAQTNWPNAELVEVLLLAVGLVLTIFGSLVLIFVDETAPEVLAQNLLLESAAAELDSRFDYYDMYQNHLLARLSVNSQVRELVETAVISGVPDKATLAKHANAIVSIFVERRNVLFGVGDEYWNFSVYYHDAGSDRLECIACRRENAEDEQLDHRTWKSGEGHVGLCFARGKEVIFSDANKPELKPVLAANGQNVRDYDQDRYVSLASIPISTDGQRPLGVLIATSSEAGRFKNDEERDEKEWENADTLRDVASSLAIIFRLIHPSDVAGGPINDDD